MDATIKSSSGKTTTAPLKQRTLSVAERRKRALKGLGISWGLMLVTLPLPPIHWVTVPFFFFFGFYLLWKRFHEAVFLEPFQFACPECGKPVDVAPQSLKGHWEIVCPHCRFPLRAETGRPA